MDYLIPVKNDNINLLSISDDDLDGLSPFNIDWGIELPKQSNVDNIERAAETPSIDSDDYGEEEAFVLKILTSQVREVCNVNTSWKKRKKAWDWCFNLEARDKNGITFKDACEALGGRPEVLQAKIHNQLYTAGIPFKEEVKPFWMAQMPEHYVSESIMAAWEDGLTVVQKLWQWPGIPMNILEESVDVEDCMETLNKLEKFGLVAWRFGCVFLIGRADRTTQMRAFSWSKSFF